MTLDQACDTLPAGSVWSSSFGFPYDRGYTEFWRAPDGTRYQIMHQAFAGSPADWKAVEV